MSKRLKTIFIIAAVMVSVCAVFLVGIFGATFANVNKCIEEQTARLNLLRDNYAQNKYKRVDERDFCDFDLDKALDRNLKLIDLQFFATHNSYKKQKTPLERFYAKFSDGLERGNYFFETPTDQLNAGIRSFEFDLFYKHNKSGVSFHSFHIGYADVSSNAFNFAECLEEIDLWSKNNPNHLPVTIIIELKERGGMYPYKTIGKEQLPELDALIKDKISTLYSPSEAFAGYENLNEMRANHDSPTLKDTMGKVMFIIHRGAQTENYINLDKTYQTQAMFPSGFYWVDDVMADYQFVIINNHGFYDGNIEENGGRKDRYLFRIMIDCEVPNPSVQDVELAIATGATICSTNRPPQLNPCENYQSVEFAPDGKTVRLVGDVVL